MLFSLFVLSFVKSISIIFRAVEDNTNNYESIYQFDGRETALLYLMTEREGLGLCLDERNIGERRCLHILTVLILPASGRAKASLGRGAGERVLVSRAALPVLSERLELFLGERQNSSAEPANSANVVIYYSLVAVLVTDVSLASGNALIHVSKHGLNIAGPTTNVCFSTNLQANT